MTGALPDPSHGGVPVRPQDGLPPVPAQRARPGLSRPITGGPAGDPLPARLAVLTAIDRRGPPARGIRHQPHRRRRLLGLAAWAVQTRAISAALADAPLSAPASGTAPRRRGRAGRPAWPY
uniref:Uncharacterized protein n=2 Tax=unclassified Streptomyces TaxID=2593676 RepID=V9Z7V4_9ACTN|nr:hypothetical protein pFRL3_200 [Streptomyces sp. FR1]AHE39461.1 hypothetical protein pFRL4_228 [Streptomyces sp. F2]